MRPLSTRSREKITALSILSTAVLLLAITTYFIAECAQHGGVMVKTMQGWMCFDVGKHDQ